MQQKPSQRKTFPGFIKVVALLLCGILCFEQTGFAQVAGQLDLSGSISNALGSFSSVFSRPPHLRYVAYDKLNQSFKIILNKGDAGIAQAVTSGESANQPLKFFFIGLAMPNEDLWVNLRQDAPDEIINDYLAKTDLGKILLKADLELKKELARSTFPSTPSGKEYWDKIYKKIEAVYGYGAQHAQVAINTRIWITPGEVVICQDQNSAYIYKAGLNVTTEAAYLSNKQVEKETGDQNSRLINKYSSELMQELILPQIAKEVNTGKKYAALRQVYYSLILAQWFKKKFYGAGGLYPYLIDRSNLSGLTSKKPWSKNTYFKEYQRSIREKEYDLQVQVFSLFGSSVRTYATGGVDFTGVFKGTGPAQVSLISSNSFSPPLTGQANLLAVDTHGSTLDDPYESRLSQAPVSAETVPLPIIGAVRQQKKNAAAYRLQTSVTRKDNSDAQGADVSVSDQGSFPAQPKKLSEAELDGIVESLRSSNRRYLQALFNSRRINIRERIRFVADELGFDIANGQGVSLLTRNQETLLRNREFLEGLVLPVNVTNLKSSKRGFVVRELRQIVKYAQWQQLTNEERLAVASYLFDVYGLRHSWVTRDTEWNRILAEFNLQNTPLDYSSRAIDFIQQYELARFLRFGNAPRAESRMAKIQEIVEIMGLKVAERMERVETPEGFQLYVAKQGSGNNETEKLPVVANAPIDYSEGAEPASPEELKEDRDSGEKIAPQDLPLVAAIANEAETTDSISPETFSVTDQSGIRPENSSIVESADAGLLNSLEAAISTKMTDLQVQTILNILINFHPGEANYEQVRAILRHIHPDEFKRASKAAKETEPFASNQLLQERFDSIATERPSDLSIDLARAVSKIHDWENLLKQPTLSPQDVSLIMGHSDRITTLLSLRLKQETNDSIGSIYKVMRQALGLIQRTVIKLLEQKDLDGKLYGARVKILLKRGHTISDYIAILGYLTDLDLCKKYLIEDSNPNGYGGYTNAHGNGFSNGHSNGNTPKVSYSWWHKITAVPFIETNAMSNLKVLLPLVNTDGNESTVQEYFLNLKPTRIGSSRAWSIRKPVTVFLSLFLSTISLTLFIFATPFTAISLLIVFKGFLAIFGIVSVPLMHYVFANIGARGQMRDLKASHSRISDLERQWNTKFLSSGDVISHLNAPISAASPESIPQLVSASSGGMASQVGTGMPIVNARIEEDHAVEGDLVSRQDVEAIAELAGALGIEPIEPLEINRELEKLFGPGRFSRPEILIVPEALMLTKANDKISHPVRLGNRIFAGDQYFAQNKDNLAVFLADIAHEQMAQWVAGRHPNLNSGTAHDLAAEMAKVVEVGQGNGQAAAETGTVDAARSLLPGSAPGGIDFRRIDFTVKNMPETGNKKTAAGAGEGAVDAYAEQEMTQINRMIRAKIIPSGERLRECWKSVPASSQQRYIKQINNSLAEIFMLEEEYGKPSENSLVSLLQAVVLN